MKQWLGKVLMALAASAMIAGAFGALGESTAFAIGQRLPVTLSEEVQRLQFSPEVNNVYAVNLLPADDWGFSAETALYQDGVPMAEGGDALSARLIAGAECVLELKGWGNAVLEVSRDTLSRCFGKPLEINEGDGYSKLIALAGDVHWYRFVSQQDGLAVVYALPKDQGLRLECVLMDDAGRELSRMTSGESGGTAIFTTLEAQRTYYVRVSAEDSATTGEYELDVVRDGAATKPEGVRLSMSSVTLNKGEVVNLTVEIEPQDAFSGCYFRSSNENVAGVTQSGVVTARSAGKAEITAMVYGGIQAVCEVTVERVPLSGIAFETSRVSLRAGEQAALMLEYYPQDATNRSVTYVSSDPSIARVNNAGVVLGLKQGKTTITVKTLDGGYEDVVEVNVKRASPGLYALLVGEQAYTDDKVDRTGSANSIRSIEQMLAELTLEGGTFQTSTLYDASASGVFSAIRTAFAQAKERDTSLLYITCHGYYRHGMSFLQMSDGSEISARDLERELRQVKGRVIVIVDCCGSGGVLGAATQPEDFNAGVISAFSGYVGDSVFGSSKYKVLASAALDQDSYRVGFSGTATEERMATVFARALCDAAGWSIDKNLRSAMRADMDFDRKLTLDELWLYTSKRVMWYLNLASNMSSSGGYVQNVQVYPQNDAAVIFER
ncbi:MAG: Ig-like domain-containing protein [Eubacteriales bacterium]|nr:Ig-like domain-containing protein [Eubacteriales bacterium]